MNAVPSNTPQFQLITDMQERQRVVGHVLRYELYRHRDISDRLSDLLNVKDDPDAFNRSTWDIIYYLMQSHLQEVVPSVTDIYLSTNLSKGTAITGLAELERRGAIRKVRDELDGRRRRIDISESVAELLEYFIAECGARLGQPYEIGPQEPVPGTSAENSSNDSLIDLLNRLSHELRTPLTAILGFSEMIAEETLGPVQPNGYAEYARDIRRAASHLLSSLNDTVDTTLADHGVDIPLGPLVYIDIEEIVDSACRAAAGVAERKGVVLRRKWGSTKVRTLADSERLIQAIRKLIDGAVASTGRGQTIDIETGIDQRDMLTLKIISPESSTTPHQNDPDAPIGSPGGSNFAKNMPLIRAIAEAHGGDILTQQDGPRRHVLSLRLPKDGPKPPS